MQRPRKETLGYINMPQTWKQIKNISKACKKQTYSNVSMSVNKQTNMVFLLEASCSKFFLFQHRRPPAELIFIGVTIINRVIKIISPPAAFIKVNTINNIIISTIMVIKIISSSLSSASFWHHQYVPHCQYYDLIVNIIIILS